MIFRMFAPSVPVYLIQFKGELDVDLDPEDIASLMTLPQAEMAQVNVHELLAGVCPWGTLDDMELINMTSEEAEEIMTNLPSIWGGVEGHKDFKDPFEAVEALAAKFVPVLGMNFVDDDEAV